MCHRMTVGAQRPHVGAGIDEPFAPCQGSQMVDVNEPPADRSIARLKVDSAGRAQVPVNLETQSTSSWISFGSTENDVFSCTLDSEGLLVGRRRGVDLAVDDCVPRNQADAVGYPDVLTNSELRAGSKRLFGLEDDVAVLVKERAGKPLDLVVPIARLSIERVPDVKIPTLRARHRAV